VAQVISRGVLRAADGGIGLGHIALVMKPVVACFAKTHRCSTSFRRAGPVISSATARTRVQRARIKARLVPESSALINQLVTASWPRSIRKSLVLTQRDRALPPSKHAASFVTWAVSTSSSPSTLATK